MPKFSAISDVHREFITKQKMFFVGTGGAGGARQYRTERNGVTPRHGAKQDRLAQPDGGRKRDCGAFTGVATDDADVVLV